MTAEHRDQDMIDGQAAEWAALRLGGDALHQESEFRAWLRSDPRCKAAYDDAMKCWRRASVLARPRPKRRPKLQFLAAAACAVGLSLFGIIRICTDAPPYADSMAWTESGQFRRSTLPDGSIMILGPHSAADWSFDKDRRMVRLRGGQAYFTARPKSAQDPRPFVVETDDCRIRALGTQFMVQSGPDGSDVTVTEHQVEVTPRNGAVRPGRVVAEGRSLRYSGGNYYPDIPSPAAEARLWAAGKAAFDDRPLHAVLDTLNRYRRDRLFITDSALADRRISGVFSIDDPDAALAALSKGLHIRTVSVPFVGTWLRRDS